MDEITRLGIVMLVFFLGNACLHMVTNVHINEAMKKILDSFEDVKETVHNGGKLEPATTKEKNNEARTSR